jgi:hypothetical protein
MQSKVAIQEILLTRAEGPTDQCVRKSFDNFKRANKHLLEVCQSVPAGSHKVDFVAVFKDGETYHGRFDAGSPNQEGFTAPDLGQHMRRHLEYTSGLRKPSFWSEERYAEFLTKQTKDNPKAEANALAFLQKYALRDEAAVPKQNEDQKTREPGKLGKPGKAPSALKVRLDAIFSDLQPMAVKEMLGKLREISNLILESKQPESTRSLLATLKSCGDTLALLELEENEAQLDHVSLKAQNIMQAMSILLYALTADIE